MNIQVQNSVRSRHVFYVPGYDPMPPRRYRELYRKEGQEQAAISGYELTLNGRRSQGGNYAWDVIWRGVGGQTRTRFEFLSWDRIVYDSLDTTIARSYWMLVSTLWLYLRSGALWALFRLRRAPIIAALYPVVVLLVQTVVALILARVVGGLVAGPVGWILGAAVFAGLLILFRRFDRRFFAYYLLHDFAFWAQNKGAMPKVLLPKIGEFADRVEAVLDSGCDEVLLVGHSSGAHMAVSICAEVLRRRKVDKLSLLTLGEAIPVVSFLPAAADLRRDLHLLSTRKDLYWLDVTAQGDGACFALCDPVAVSGVAPAPQQHHNPVVISAAFRNTLSPEKHASQKWQFFRRHIQYLCAFDRPGDYEYFLVTAGPQTLRQRFGGRGSSAAREGRAFSPHRTLAP